MLNEHINAIGLLARDIAEAALQPDAPDDLGVIYSDLAVAAGTLLPPISEPPAAQHAVMLAKLMVKLVKQKQDEWEKGDEDDDRFKAFDETEVLTAYRRRARRYGQERIVRRSREVTVLGEDRDKVSIRALVYDNGAKVVALTPDAGSGRGRACLISPSAAREAAAALIAAADAVEAASSL